jgi:hypothetical protein
VKVIVVPDEGSFFAQGIEEDYGAQGGSVEDALTTFKRGMELTIRTRRKRGLDDLTGPPPQSVMDEFSATAGAVEMDVEINA